MISYSPHTKRFSVSPQSIKNVSPHTVTITLTEVFFSISVQGVGGQEPLTGGPKPAFSLSAVTVFHTNSTGCTLTAVISAVI